MNGSAADADLAMDVLDGLRREGKRIVFTNGCFDLLHPGHVRSLQQAKGFGDVLVVGLNTDGSVRRLKGEGRPVLPLARRKAMLEALDCVDYVIPFDADTPIELITRIRPDVLAKGRDCEDKVIPGAEYVRSYGGEVRLTDIVPGYSTTHAIEAARSAQK